MAWKCGCVCHTALTTSSSFTKDCCYCTLQQKTKKAKPVKVWGWKHKGRVMPFCTQSKEDATFHRGKDETVIRIEMREI